MKFAIKVYYGNFPNFIFNLKYFGLNKIFIFPLYFINASQIFLSDLDDSIYVLCIMGGFYLREIYFRKFQNCKNSKCRSNLCLMNFHSGNFTCTNCMIFSHCVLLQCQTEHIIQFVQVKLRSEEHTSEL